MLKFTSLKSFNQFVFENPLHKVSGWEDEPYLGSVVHISGEKSQYEILLCEEELESGMLPHLDFKSLSSDKKQYLWGCFLIGAIHSGMYQLYPKDALVISNYVRNTRNGK